MPTQPIESDTLLDEIDHHFRVFAGPGAGKTFWLVEHMKNILNRSDRLMPPARVACISYTNVAVATIRQRLSPSADLVDVSTIHSFFYRNVVKPYLHLLKDASGNPLVNYSAVDGHDEHRPSVSLVRQWLSSEGVQDRLFLQNRREWQNYLTKLTWRRDAAAAKWSLTRIGRGPLPKYLPATKLGSYKLPYWNQGTIDHEDVLYFAYRILDENPEIVPFLSARFPYLLIDEFQDTNPIQTQVARWLGEAGTVVGVIGDAEQAIFGFQGSVYKDFLDFSLAGQIDYEIGGNRRSTNQIVAVLNHARRDGLSQQGVRNHDGPLVRVLTGSLEACVKSATALGSDGENRQVVILARDNLTASRIRRLSGTDTDNIWDRLRDIDSDREWFLRHIIAAGELARKDQCPLAVKEAIRGVRMRDGKFRAPLSYGHSVSDLERRSVAVCAVQYIVSQHDDTSKQTLLQVYQALADMFGRALPDLKLKRVSGGRFKSFAETTNYSDMVGSVSLTEDIRSVRTIHKAKGDEFHCLLVALAQEKDLLRMFSPSEEAKGDQEERRITYVAISRARDELMISVPSLSAEAGRQLAGLGVQVTEVQEEDLSLSKDQNAIVATTGR